MPFLRHLTLALALLAGHIGCGAGCATHFPVPLGQEATCAGLSYRVLDCQWAHQLEPGGGRVVPTYSFLLVHLEVTNSSSAALAAGWLPRVWLLDEHHEVFAAHPVTAALCGGLRGSAAAWQPGGKLSRLLVYDVPQALYWLKPEGCHRALELRCWWPERFGD